MITFSSNGNLERLQDDDQHKEFSNETRNGSFERNGDGGVGGRLLQAGYIVPDWEYNWGSPTSESPTATTGGLWWLNTGSGPQPLTIDINLEVWGGKTKNNTSLCYSGSYPAILLVSDHSGYGSYEAVTQWQPSYPGRFSAGAYRGDLVPGTTQQDGATAWIEIKAWTGDYARYSDALAASQAGQAVYVADVEFQSPTSSITTVPIQAMQDSPASGLGEGGSRSRAVHVSVKRCRASGVGDLRLAKAALMTPDSSLSVATGIGRKQGPLGDHLRSPSAAFVARLSGDDQPTNNTVQGTYK